MKSSTVTLEMAEGNGFIRTNGLANGNGSVRSQKSPNGGAIQEVKATNASIKPAMNNYTVKPRQTRRAGGSSLVARIFSAITRLFTWYSIVSILFRCPSGLQQCDETSPRICKPYFQLKSAIAPHVTPFYNTYASPYVELAEPYYDVVDKKVLTPSRVFAEKYAAPRVSQVQQYGQAQWAKTVQPELVKYETLVKAQYDKSLAPHVQQASTVVSPYYNIARTSALQTYHEHLLPGYTFLQPFALQGYGLASAFTTGTVVPSLAWAWTKAYLFLDSTILPRINGMYAENVEPQLVKIGQRLGRHSGSQKAVVETLSSTASKAASSFTRPAASTTALSTPASVSAATSDVEPETATAEPASSQVSATSVDSATETGVGSVKAPEAGDNEDDERRSARETVAEDLEAWQEKYAKAADEAGAEIETQVDEIAKRMIRRQVNVMGKSLVRQLEDTVQSEITSLKSSIQAIASKPSAGSDDDINAAVRKAGIQIKTKATDVRNWRTNYETELQTAVTKAAENHFKILDHIRDLALQKIGMKWAWMDGVTYKDWAKYHLLKERFDEWQGDLQNLIIAHPSLEDAQEKGHVVEDEAMEIAQSAAKDLANLKQVAKWKLAAGDASDNFDVESTREAAESAEKTTPNSEVDADDVSVADPLVKKASMLSGESPATELEPSSATNEPTAPVASSILEEVVSSALPTSATDATSATSSSIEVPVASSILEEVVASALPTSDPEAPEPEAAQVILEETPVFARNTTEQTAAPEPAPVQIPLNEDDELIEEDRTWKSKPTAPVKSAMFGAAAQSVPSRQPIIDDDTYESASSVISALRTDVPNSATSAAASMYSAAMAQADAKYSRALSLVQKQAKSTPTPIYERMLREVTIAYNAAKSVASGNLESAQRAAKTGVLASPITAYIPPMPTIMDWAAVESLASQRLVEGRLWAEQQYEAAKVAVGAATPTPTDFSGSMSSAASVAGASAASVTAAAGANAEKLLQNAQYNYYAGLGLAQARYSDFIAAASKAYGSIGATPTPTDMAGTMSSAASVASASASSAASVASAYADSAASAASASAASAASVVSDGASSAYSAASDSAASAASVVADTVNSAAAVGYDGVASGYDGAAAAAAAAGDYAQESWDSVVSQLSVQVYGAPTPTYWYESIASAAGEYAASATSALGGGANTATSAANTYAAAATDEAAKQYAMVSSIISELVIGKEPTFSESVYSRLSLAYVTATASASSVASVASASVSSVAAAATDKVKDEL